jgi:hypothetical protein
MRSIGCLEIHMAVVDRGYDELVFSIREAKIQGGTFDIPGERLRFLTLTKSVGPYLKIRSGSVRLQDEGGGARIQPPANQRLG